MPRREQVRMSADEVTAFLDEERTLNVATIGPTGAIHLVAMWYVVEDGCPLFWTYERSQKVANLRRDARMTALVESGDTYAELRGVELVGRGEIVTDHDEALRVGRALATKYYGDPSGVESAGAKRVLVRLHVDQTVSWDHRKLGG
jgi:PPOX class probable F420-dependent enzyme